MKWTLADFRPPGMQAPRADKPRQWRGRDDPFVFASCDPDIRSRRLRGQWPDWRTKGDYQSITKRDLRAIGWQFLRRNPAYISDWHAWKAQHSIEAAASGVEWDGMKPASDRVCSRYGLARTVYPPAPDLNALPAVEGEPQRQAWMVRMQTGGWIEDFSAPEDGDYLDVRLYADGSVTDQLEAVKRRLLAFRESVGLPSRRKIDLRPRDELVRYLRILDAKAAWAPNKEICATLYPKLGRLAAQKTLSRNFTVAKTLAQTGYRTLLWASIPE